MRDPLTYLHSLEQFGIKFGLDNISAIVARLEHPERAFRSVHVAGTNGKGSVTAMVDSALRAAGHRSARYTSPHLVNLAERFTIDGRPVSSPDLEAAVADVRDAIEALVREGTLDVQPTFFEATTAIAFELFRRAGVDVAVLEVGLGGRLDATNVVSPTVTAITSIAFDHQQYLGTTLREIAREKAGIIKPGVPVVVGALPADADAVIEQIARERGADLIRALPDDVAGLALDWRVLINARTRPWPGGSSRRSMLGGLRVPPSAIAEGLAQPAWPGRLDLRRLADGREVLMDAAHNPAGAAALASYIFEWMPGEPKPPLVFACHARQGRPGNVRSVAARRRSSRRDARVKRASGRAG